MTGEHYPNKTVENRTNVLQHQESSSLSSSSALPPTDHQQLIMRPYHVSNNFFESTNNRNRLFNVMQPTMAAKERRMQKLIDIIDEALSICSDVDVNINEIDETSVRIGAGQ
jgi:hypothetical protein